MRIYERIEAHAERLRSPSPVPGNVGIMQSASPSDHETADALNDISDALLVRDAEMDELKRTLAWAAAGFIAALLFVAML